MFFSLMFLIKNLYINKKLIDDLTAIKLKLSTFVEKNALVSDIDNNRFLKCDN